MSESQTYIVGKAIFAYNLAENDGGEISQRIYQGSAFEYIGKYCKHMGVPGLSRQS